MKKTNKVSVLLAAMASLLLAGVAWAAGAQSATWNVSTGGMDWSILIPENGSVLTVGGDGVNYRKIFSAGEKPRFSPNDIQGSLADGTYKWELSIVPRGIEPVDESGENNGRQTGLSASKQAPIRSRVERRELEKSLVQSGGFTVQNGGIIDPNQIEPGAVPSNGAEGEGSSQ